MNAPILSFFAAHAPRQAQRHGRRRRFFRCPACRAVQIVPAGCGQTKIVCRQVRGDILKENLNNDGPPRNTLRKEGAPGRFFCKRAFRQFSKQTIQFPALR